VGTEDGDRPPEPRWFWFALSFVIPIMGVILGILYSGKPDPAAKRFGKNCLLAAAAAIVAAGCCGVLYVLFAVGGLTGNLFAHNPSL
jgi:hypothetical protein